MIVEAIEEALRMAICRKMRNIMRKERQGQVEARSPNEIRSAARKY